MIATAQQPSALHFDEAKHEYSVNGVVLPSVTQIIHAAFPDPYRFARLEDVEFKRDIGDAVHKATHYFDEGDLDLSTLDLRIQPYLKAYRRFVVERNYEPIFCERRMYSQRYGYAGTVDKVGTMVHDKGHRVVVDIKCTATVSPLVPLQTAAYSMLLSDTSVVPMQRYCLHLQDNGKYKLHPHFDTYGDQAGFLGCLNRFKWAERAGLNKEAK